MVYLGGRCIHGWCIEMSQMNRGDRNLNRGVNRGIGVIGGSVPPIPQQALAGNSGPYDAR